MVFVSEGSTSIVDEVASGSKRREEGKVKISTSANLISASSTMRGNSIVHPFLGGRRSH